MKSSFIAKISPKNIVTFASFFVPSLYQLLEKGYFHPYDEDLFINSFAINNKNKRYSSQTISELNAEIDTKQKAEVMIQTTFADAEIKKNVIVNFVQTPAAIFGITLGADDHYVVSKQDTIRKNVIVVNVLYDNIYQLYNQDRLRAFAGHETVHIKHAHSDFQAFLRGGCFSYALGAASIKNLLYKRMPLIFIADLMYKKFCEADADISSALWFKTQDILIEYFEQSQEQIEVFSKPERIALSVIDGHFSFKTRICYLNYLKHHSTLFSRTNLSVTVDDATKNINNNNEHVNNENRSQRTSRIKK